MKRRILIAAAGAAVYFALDSVHVAIGIWRPAASPALPWWFIFIYFGGLLGCAQLVGRLEARAGGRFRPALALDAVMCVALLAVHILFFENELLLAVLCAALLVARFATLRRPGDLLFAAIVAGIEAGIELPLAAAGLFAYSHASLGPLPLWHVPFWAGLGVCLRGLFRLADVAGRPGAAAERRPAPARAGA